MRGPAGQPSVTGPLRFREALVISLAVLGLGAVLAYTWQRDRDRERRVIAEVIGSTPIPVLQDETPLATTGTDRLRDQAALAMAAESSGAAEAALTELLRRDPLDLEARYLLATLLAATGEPARARRHLELLAGLGPEAVPEAARYRELARRELGR